MILVIVRCPARTCRRAYQSPSIGTDCGPQCAQMPNFASRNHSGHRYCLSDSIVGSNGPVAIFSCTAVCPPAAAAASSSPAPIQIFILSAFVPRNDTPPDVYCFIPPRIGPARWVALCELFFFAFLCVSASLREDKTSTTRRCAREELFGGPWRRRDPRRERGCRRRSRSRRRRAAACYWWPDTAARCCR